MPLSIITHALTHPGRIRERNEDSVLIYQPINPHDDAALLIVADGMGGYRAGDQASKLAIEIIRAELDPLFVPSSNQPTVRLHKKTDDGERSTVELPETATSEHYSGFITRAVRAANQAIVDYGQQHRDARGMGSTVTLAVIAHNRVYFANVGDSRAYLFRENTLRQITRDHSLVARLVETGEIKVDDIYAHPKRNLIYRSLGSDPGDIEVDLFEEGVQHGDLVLLCSDGLWEKVHTTELEAILRESGDLAAMEQLLIDRANQEGGEDNISVVMARCLDPNTGSRRSADISEEDTGKFGTTTTPDGTGSTIT